MSTQTLLLVLAIHAMALVSPGPDFAIVTRTAMVSSRVAGLFAAAGVATAIGLYVLICALGLSAVLVALPALSQFLTVVGAAYLGWLGWQCLLSKGELPEADTESGRGSAFARGFLTNLLNPKAMLYFSSILSQVFSPAMTLADTVMLIVLMVSESFLWFAMVAVAFSSQRVLQWLRGRVVWFDRVVGVVLLGMAARVVATASR